MVVKTKWVYGITSVVLSIGLLGLHTGCHVVSPKEGAKQSEFSGPTEKVIFEFGQEDKNEIEFPQRGFRGHPEYRCRVGVNCTTETFPRYLYVTVDEYVDDGVERIIISFKLDQTYDDVILRLARGGDETTVVTFDRKRTYLVTNTMLGSGENYRFGVYNLKLGTLKKGRHRCELTVADDGKGNRGFAWDALALIAK